MAAFDSLQRAGFAGFEFPVSEIRVTGALREHVHEYPHAPGGAPEKLGRKLYEFHMRAPFHNTFLSYPKLWPETIASLRIIFEGGRSFDLIVPTIGLITAYCTSWVETADMRSARSGVSVEMTFREDQTDLFLVKELVAARAADLQNAGRVFTKDIVEGKDLQGNIFDSIQEMLNSISGIGDQFELYGTLFKAKLDGIANACSAIDRSFSFFNKPQNHASTEALHALWAAALKLSKDVEKRAAPVERFRVPIVMSVADVSRRLYGNSTRAMEILRMNAIENPFAITAGTVLVVYAPERLAA
jgi:hypothetical protein